MLVKSRKNSFILKDVLTLLDDIADKRQEHLVFLGTVNASICHPREIFAVAIADAASSIIVSHNHPSGNATPSGEDIKTTQQLVAAGIIIGIPLTDHLIMTQSDHFSFLQNGLSL